MPHIAKNHPQATQPLQKLANHSDGEEAVSPTEKSDDNSMIESFEDDTEGKVVSNENDVMSPVQLVNKPLFEIERKLPGSTSGV